MTSAARTAVLGASGYVGATLSDLLAKSGPVARLMRQPRTADDRRWDFWKDAAGPAIADATSIVFVARVHPLEGAGDPVIMDRYEARLREFVRQCGRRHLVVVSTDAVFRGDRGNYAEHDEPQPVTAYGACARLVEKIVAEHAARWCVVRPSYIYGFGASGLDKRLASAVRAATDEAPFDVFPEMFRSPIEVSDLCRAIEVVVRTETEGFVHAGGPRVSVADFFRVGLKALGHQPTVLKDKGVDARATRLDTSLLSRRLVDELRVTPRTIYEALTSPKEQAS